jgi:hypothetical protein
MANASCNWTKPGTVPSEQTGSGLGSANFSPKGINCPTATARCSEDTLQSFAHALSIGVTLELDVNVMRDDVPVVSNGLRSSGPPHATGHAA